MSHRRYLKYILVFGILSVAIAVIAVMTARRTPAPGAAATFEQATPPEAPPIHAANDEPAIEQPASEQPAGEQTAYETFAPDEDLSDTLELSEIIDKQMDDLEKRERERLEKARKELLAKLFPLRGMPDAELIAHMEEFLDEFGIGAETYQLATILAAVYCQTERLDDGRRVYSELIAALPEKRYLYMKQSVTMQMAQMEGSVGDLAVAEELLLGIIEAPVPARFAQGTLTSSNICKSRRRSMRRCFWRGCMCRQSALRMYLEPSTLSSPPHWRCRRATRFSEASRLVSAGPMCAVPSSCWPKLSRKESTRRQTPHLR